MSNSDSDEYLAMSGVHVEVPQTSNTDFSSLFEVARQILGNDHDVQKLRDLVDNAESVSIPSDEIIELFAEPLAKEDSEANKQLLDRLKALRSKVAHQRKDDSSFMYRLRQAILRSSRHNAVIEEAIKIRQEISRDEEANFKQAQVLFDNVGSRVVAWQQGVGAQWNEIVGVGWDLELVTGQEVTLDDSQMEKARSFLSSYNRHFRETEYLVNKLFPQLQALKKKIWHFRRGLRLFGGLVPQPVSNVEATEVFTPTKQQKDNPMFMHCLNKIGFKKTCDFEDLAILLDKGHCKQITKVKAVKRWFKILRPLGEEGVDYKVIQATESHVRQGVAVEVGAPVINYIKGKTFFDTKEAIEVFITVWKVKEVKSVLRQELGHKPTLEEVANEMGLDPVKLKWVY